MRHVHTFAARAASSSGLVAVRANAAPPRLNSAADLAAAFETFRTNYDNRHAQLQATLDEMARITATSRLNGGGPDLRAPDPEYSGIFASFIREGGGEDQLREQNRTGDRREIRAAMSEGSNTDGGYLAPVEWDRRIRQAQVAVSPMRRLATVVETNVGAYSTVWNNAQWGSGWVGETATRPQTTTASLQPLIFPTGEIYAMPAVTQRLLDDALVDVQQFVTTQLSTEFSRQEGLAFLSGDGVNKPAGLLTYVVGGANATTHPGGALDVVPTGAAATLGASASAITDTLTDFAYGLAAPYRANASWLMNSTTAATLAKLKDANGQPLWRESLIVGQPSTLLGRPVEIDENMPNIAAGTFPIAFGDFRTGYVINDRLGVMILRDPYTAKPYVLFYATKRVGGGVADPKAIRLLKVAAS